MSGGVRNPVCDRCGHPWATHEHGGEFWCAATGLVGLCDCRGFVHLGLDDQPRRRKSQRGNV